MKTKSVKHIDQRIDAFDFTVLRERYLSVTNDSEDGFSEAVTEFRKFLKLVARTDKALAVLSRRVDDLWHTFIIFTPQYRRFCEETFGEFIDHQPHTTDFKVPEEAILNIREEYEKEFGEIHPSWLREIDEATLAWMEGGPQPAQIGYQWSGWTGRAKSRN